MAPLLVLTLAVTALGAWGGPADPDVEFTGVQIAGCFALFLAWSLCVLCWGHLLGRRLLRRRQPDLLSAFLFGTLAASLTGMAFAHLGLVGGGYRWILFAVAFAGSVLDHFSGGEGFFFLVRARLRSVLGDDWLGRIIAVVIFLLVAARVVSASYLSGHSDPLMYHLLGPRLWWQAGRFYFPPDSPVVMVCSYWEYLFVWGNALFSGERGLGLIEGQFFGQWAHTFFGFGGTALALNALFGRARLSPAWLKIVVLSGLSSLSLKGFSLTAKNDWGAIFWALAGGALLFGGEWGALMAAIGAFAVGIAFASKFVLFFYTLPIMTAWCLAELARKGPRAGAGRVLLVCGAFALACAPLMLRNALATGNPVFPWLNKLFGSPYLSDTAAATNEGQEFFTRGGIRLWDKTWRLLHESPLNRTFVLLPLAAMLDPRVRGLRVLWAACLASLALFVFRPVSGTVFFRWLSAGLILFGALNAVTVAALAERIERLYRPLGTALALGVTLFLAQQNMVWDEWSELFKGPSPTLLIRSSTGAFIGGEAKAWLRLNASANDLIFSTADNQTYYVSYLPIRSLYHNAEIDHRARHIADPRALLELMRAEGGRYLLDTLHWSTYREHRVNYWGDYSFRLAALLMENSEAVVFWGDLSVVVDLVKLEEAIRGECQLVVQGRVPT